LLTGPIFTFDYAVWTNRSTGLSTSCKTSCQDKLGKTPWCTLITSWSICRRKTTTKRWCVTAQQVSEELGGDK
jgi:hypothetical protein